MACSQHINPVLVKKHCYQCNKKWEPKFQGSVLIKGKTKSFHDSECIMREYKTFPCIKLLESLDMPTYYWIFWISKHVDVAIKLVHHVKVVVWNIEQCICCVCYNKKCFVILPWIMDHTHPFWSWTHGFSKLTLATTHAWTMIVLSSVHYVREC